VTLIALVPTSRNNTIKNVASFLIANAEVVIEATYARTVILKKDVTLIVIKLRRLRDFLELFEKSIALGLQQRLSTKPIVPKRHYVISVTCSKDGGNSVVLHMLIL
jgi:hypothetical protein